jgi:hypothetical protein
LQASHLGTLAAVDLVAGAGPTMVRQEEPSLRTIIMVMINTPVRSGMFLKIGMEGRDLPHLLLLRSGAELPEGYSRGEGISVSFYQPRCGKKVAIGHCVRLAVCAEGSI